MPNIIQIGKVILIGCVRLFLKIFYVKRVKNNQILFMTNSGKSYNCNPKYIYEHLVKKYPNKFIFVWILNNTDGRKPTDAIIVRPRTLKYYYYAITSKFVISNMGFPTEIPKRRGQVYINTWHGGGAYKKMGLDTTLSAIEQGILKEAGKRTDLVLSSNRKFSEIMKSARNISRTAFLKSGMPRNDMFFGKRNDALYQKVKKDLELTENKIVLYAPTYRGSEKNPKGRFDLDPRQTERALKQRFGGEWVTIIRKHPMDKQKVDENIKDVSFYDDMQELLYISDVLITDYSSSVWDFSFTGRPCFILAADIFEYERDRGFYTPIKSWPFPIAVDMEQLVQNIRQFDKDSYQKKVEKHHQDLGSYERGNACEQVGEFILQRMKLS